MQPAPRAPGPFGFGSPVPPAPEPSCPPRCSTGNEAIPTTRHPGADPSAGTPDPGVDLLAHAPSLSTTQLEQLERLARLVAEWGSRINLSGHRDPPAILAGLVADALALGAMLDDLLASWPAHVADLGSGAGFPGLPLAILHPDAQFELVDSRRRRHHFQRAACRTLGLPNVRPRLGRIEDLDPTLSGLVIAQAVGPIRTVVEAARRWVAPGGWLVVPTGPAPPPFDPGAEWSASGSRAYTVDPGSRPRSLWFARRPGAGANADSP